MLLEDIEPGTGRMNYNLSINVKCDSSDSSDDLPTPAKENRMESQKLLEFHPHHEVRSDETLKRSMKTIEIDVNPFSYTPENDKKQQPLCDDVDSLCRLSLDEFQVANCRKHSLKSLFQITERDDEYSMTTTSLNLGWQRDKLRYQRNAIDQIRMSNGSSFGRSINTSVISEFIEQ